MLIGALVGAVTAGATGSWLVGLVAAAVAGGVVGLLFSWTITRMGANEIIAGLGLNILLGGVIGYGLVQVYGTSGSIRPEGLTRIPRLAVPGIDGIPYVGAVLSGKDPLTWLAWLLVPVVVVVLRRTRWGLRVRATGAAETAARSLGLATRRTRDASTVVAGALAGLGGAHLSLGLVGLFNQRMVAGRGFIALAAFYFGRNRPWPTAGACLLFAVFDALQVRLQGQGVPAQLVQTLPYVVVVLVLAVAGARESRSRARELVTAS
jgi:simple sugar transport system permease protein